MCKSYQLKLHHTRSGTFSDPQVMFYPALCTWLHAWTLQSDRTQWTGSHLGFSQMFTWVRKSKWKTTRTLNITHEQWRHHVELWDTGLLQPLENQSLYYSRTFTHVNISLPFPVCFGLELLLMGELVSFSKDLSKPLMEQSTPVTAHSCSWYSRAAFSNLRHTKIQIYCKHPTLAIYSFKHH